MISNIFHNIKINIKYNAIRLFSYMLKKLKTKPVYILMDRIHLAGDNAEVLYNYLKNKKEINAYFILDNNCFDSNRLRPDKHLLKYNGIKHIIQLIRADVFFISQETFLPNILNRYHYILDYKLVFLQHGVSFNDVSKVYNNNCGHDLVIVSSSYEYKDFITKKYGYNKEKIAIAGQARFDNLINNCKKEERVVLIVLT